MIRKLKLLLCDSCLIMVFGVGVRLVGNGLGSVMLRLLLLLLDMIVVGCLDEKLIVWKLCMWLCSVMCMFGG